MMTARSANPPSPIKRPELSAERRAGATRLAGLLTTGIAGSGKSSGSSSTSAESNVSPPSSNRPANRSFLRDGAKENSSSSSAGVGWAARGGGLYGGGARYGDGGGAAGGAETSGGSYAKVCSGSGSGKRPATPMAGIGAGISVHHTMSCGDRPPLEASVTRPW
jgi:hypothetical protein